MKPLLLSVAAAVPLASCQAKEPAIESFIASLPEGMSVESPISYTPSGFDKDVSYRVRLSAELVERDPAWAILETEPFDGPRYFDTVHISNFTIPMIDEVVPTFDLKPTEDNRTSYRLMRDAKRGVSAYFDEQGRRMAMCFADNDWCFGKSYAGELVFDYEFTESEIGRLPELNSRLQTLAQNAPRD